MHVIKEMVQPPNTVQTTVIAAYKLFNIIIEWLWVGCEELQLYADWWGCYITCMLDIPLENYITSIIQQYVFAYSCISFIQFTSEIQLFLLQIAVKLPFFSSLLPKQPYFQSNNMPSLNILCNQIYHGIDGTLSASSK